MKKNELYKLAKKSLYFIYSDLYSSGMDEKELECLQFFDELASEIFWESFISKNEKNVRNFNKDLILLKRSKRYSNYNDYKNVLNALFLEEKMVMLFYDINNSILLPIKMLNVILDSCHYFYSEDYLLFGIWYE